MGELDDGPECARGSASQPHTAGELQRWLDFGGTLRVLERSASTVTLALCRCDGGEQVDRVVSTDPQVLAFVAQGCASGEIPY